LPQVHHPATAAALVRKIQILLNSVDACVVGMQSGGLRADVNVSVRRRGSGSTGESHEYSGITGLGQRTEIKNLSSFRAVEDAIIAERDRQIDVLEAGGVIEGETRGWTLGSSETRRLRGKEGEVDYRYMPDPDLAPVIVSGGLINHLRDTMGILPDEELRNLVDEYGLTMKDAMSLVSLDDGNRAEYFYNVVDQLSGMIAAHNAVSRQTSLSIGKLCSNWVLHELGGLVVDSSEDQNELGLDIEGNCIIPAQKLAEIIFHLNNKSITGKTAKRLLASVFEDEKNGKGREVGDMIEGAGLWLRPMSADEYDSLARSILDMRVVEQILKGQKGKVMYLVGQMMRNGEEGRVEAKEAEKVVRSIIEEYRK